ncbi:MAG TPA: fibronectin type III domain-containing protein [Terriglobia bacterium]|nr:fibronectin type III domain-containing protein [Terriglobia bacterium]
MIVAQGKEKLQFWIAGLNLVLMIAFALTENALAGSLGVSWDPVQDNRIAGYRLKYGTSSRSYTQSIDLGNVTSHSFANVPEGSTYYFVVTAYDVNGVEGLPSTEVSGTVLDPNAPIKFLRISLSNVSNTSVTINWTTDQPTTGSIEYGPDFSFANSGSESTSTADHVTYLSGLIPSTVYRYRLTAIDSSNNIVTSAVLMFRTSDRTNEPARPSPEAIFIPSIIEDGRFRTNLGVNNLSKTVANVSLTLVDSEGLVLGSQTIQVAPEGMEQLNSVARFLFENAFGSDIHANLYIESDQPVIAWASQIDRATNDPSLLRSKRHGSTQILIPSAANISTFSSSLVVMNLGYSTAEVALKAYGTSGELLGQTGTPMNIAPNGVLFLENALQDLGVVNNYGPIEITSLNNVPLIATSRVSSSGGGGGFFEGLSYSEASVVQTVPHVVDNSEIRSNLGINNITDSPAMVVIRLFDKNGAQIGSGSVSVAPKGLTQINSVVRYILGKNEVANMDGYLRLESSQPIFGWASQIDNSTNDPGFAVSRGQGAVRLLIQSTANVGSFKSSLVVVNTGDMAAVVDIVSRDLGGMVTGESRGILIPAGGFFSASNILETLGVSSGFGPVEIISTNGQPVMATSRVYSSSGTSGFFEGEPI